MTKIDVTTQTLPSLEENHGAPCPFVGILSSQSICTTVGYMLLMAAAEEEHFQTTSFEQANSEANLWEKAEAECFTKKVVVYILLHTWSTQNMLKAEPSTAFSLGFYLVHYRASSMTKSANTRESGNNIQAPAPMSHRSLTMRNAE